MSSFISRRRATLSMAALLWTGCSPAIPETAPSDLQRVPNQGYEAWLDRALRRAAARGISETARAQARETAGYLPGVITRDGSQFQTRRTLEDYIAIATSDDRLREGRAAMQRNEQMLVQIEARFGVPANIVAAIWGVESRFGARRGTVPVIAATSTLAFAGRRAELFEAQFQAALRILQDGDIDAARLVGSWAGAMGHTQFIPTSYLAYAVDFTGDGRRDIWSDDPTDALASTAAYLNRNGWRAGVPWGREGTGSRTIRPQAGGPAFSITRNFDVLKRYNNSDAYAIAVGHLSDRLAGGGPLRGSFPRDAFGLLKTDRLALQRALAERGYDLGTIDGVIGPKTIAAISDFQRRSGVAVTGRPDLSLLSLLR